MKANLETVPNFRITFTREPGDDSTLPEELGVERQPGGGWRLWDNQKPFNGIVIPAEAVGPLVSILNGFDRYVAPPEPIAAPAEPAIEPDPGFRIVAPGDAIQAGDRWKFRRGNSYPVAGYLVGCPLGRPSAGSILQRPVAPKPTVEPDPGYRRVVPGEVSRDGDLWKYPDGHTIPGTPGLIHCVQTCGAILQRLDPGAIAPGHNPDRLTVAQVGIAEGWRLLNAELFTERQSVQHTEWWNPYPGRWSETGTWLFGKHCTLRTKAEKSGVVE